MGKNKKRKVSICCLEIYRDSKLIREDVFQYNSKGKLIKNE